MTVEKKNKNNTIIDLDFFKSLERAIASRSIPKDQSINSDEAEFLSNLTSYQKLSDVIDVINANASNYSSKIVSILNKSKAEAVIEKILFYILESYEREEEEKNSLIESILELNKIDKQLPFSCLTKHLSSSSQVIRLQSLYVLVVLIIESKNLTTNVSNDVILKAFEAIDKLLSVPNQDYNSFGSALLVKLLSFKQYREIYWSEQEQFVPHLYEVLLKSTDLQLKYNSLLAIWLLTFNEKVATKLPELYKDIISKYLNLAKDSVKEKISRLSIATLLNFVKVDKNESILKVFLYEKAIETFEKLNERKWADEDLKNDITQILEILNDAVINLTTFDEYEIELSKKKFNWSPPHKSEEFWIDNIDKFKQNNFKIFQQLINLLSEDNNATIDKKQKELNQTIICHDLGMIVKHSPETIKFLDKNSNLKYSIMDLMNSKNSDVKFEALKTTQILVSNSFAS